MWFIKCNHGCIVLSNSEINAATLGVGNEKKTLGTMGIYAVFTRVHIHTARVDHSGSEYQHF